MCMMRIDEEEEKYPQLPDEIMFYILSYLPLSCLFKFRCVSKLWNTLFLHPHLAFLHYRNSNSGGINLDDITGSSRETQYVLKEIEIEDREGVCFTIITKSSQGLYLQQASSIHDHESSPINTTNLRYRVECSILRQSLDIPNPQYPSLCIALDFVSSSLAVKLVSVHEHGYEILALGIGSDPTMYCWRDIKLPNLSHEKKNGIQIFFRMGVAYCIWHVEKDDDLTDIEVDVLDMVTETYIGHTTFPRGVLSSPNLMDWNGRLSFVEQVKDKLHALVLNDYRKLQWDEWIINLNFLKPDNKELMTFVTLADNSFLFFMKQDKKTLCTYDVNTAKIMTVSVLQHCIYSSEEIMDVIMLLMFHRAGGFHNY